MKREGELQGCVLIIYTFATLKSRWQDKKTYNLCDLLLPSCGPHKDHKAAPIRNASFIRVEAAWSGRTSVVVNPSIAAIPFIIIIFMKPQCVSSETVHPLNVEPACVFVMPAEECLLKVETCRKNLLTGSRSFWSCQRGNRHTTKGLSLPRFFPTVTRLWGGP